MTTTQILLSHIRDRNERKLISSSTLYNKADITVEELKLLLELADKMAKIDEPSIEHALHINVRADLISAKNKDSSS